MNKKTLIGIGCLTLVVLIAGCLAREPTEITFVITNELNEQVTSIVEPTDPFTFRDIDDYIKTLSRFLKDSTWSARKYVPKLGRSYRNAVRTTDGYLKSVNKHAVTIHKFHSGYAWLGKAEDVFQKIDGIEEATLKLSEIEEIREQTQGNLDRELEEVARRLEIIGSPVVGYVYNRAPLRREMVASGGSMKDVLGDRGVVEPLQKRRRRRGD